MNLEDVFGVKDHLTSGQECARAILVFFYGLLFVRLAGRRIFAKWPAVDVVVSIIVGSNLSRALTGGAPLFGTLAATTVLLLLHWLLSHAAALSPAISRIIEGKCVLLGKDGNVDGRALVSHAVSDADLSEALSSANVDSVHETRRIILSPSGKLAALRRRSL